jgi:hypothetical protein
MSTIIILDKTLYFHLLIIHTKISIAPFGLLVATDYTHATSADQDQLAHSYYIII